MHFRKILSGTLAVLLLSGAGALAGRGDGAVSSVAPRGGLPGVFDSVSTPGRDRAGGIVVAQATDPRVMQLEEQVRALNGRLEELNFQILQMQEQIRKMQEDNEFRLQELEKKAGIAGGAKSPSVAEAPAGDTKPADPAGQTAATPPANDPISGVIANDQTAPKPDGTGEPPRTFGTITVDKDGNVTSSTLEEPIDLTPPKTTQEQAPAAGGDLNVAALPATNDPDELYRNSYQFILSGDYASAEAGFRDHLQRFPSDAKGADSSYWLGEALIGQKKYRDAAEVLLNASKQHPKAKKAPDMLLKLGVSLVGLNQKDVACATFAEVGKRYPSASEALKQRVKQEQALAAC